MYMNEHEVRAVLQTPYYLLPVTETSIEYERYRGRLQCTVITLRFNLCSPRYSNQFMLNYVQNTLTDRFPMHTRMLASVNYDVLLLDPNSNPASYYIFRSNTNRLHFNENDEITLSLTHANLHRFCHQADQVHIPDLNVHFAHSNVVIDRVLSIVFSFSV